MRLDAHQAQVADQLTAAAALGDDRTQQIAASLAAAAGPAVRLALLGALADAANDLNAALIDLPGSPAVTVRLDPADPAQVLVDVRLADAPAGEEAAREPRREEGEPNARISLRLSEALKADIDDAAARDSVSVNTWLVRAATSALDPNPFAGFGAFGRAAGNWSGGNWGGWGDGTGRPGGPSRSAGGQRVTGWING